ncbi:MAG TPA: class I tRNA ligase family protein [Ktedonobacterales bacterium]|nr:class I tRNA ligase family protein [Ktedonobacterales bacterium]
MAKTSGTTTPAARPTHPIGRAGHDTTARAPRRPSYDFRAIEEKWRQRWEEQALYQIDLKRARRPYYNLMMFPYTSAAGLHAGNMFSYIGSDAHGRWMAMRGYDVFEPIGFDAFGVHTENYAIKTGIHPRIATAHNITHFREQLRRIGNRFDWSHELNTTDPAYYHWTQWIFVKLFKAGLAERKSAAVNWCPKDKTVLADEQVIAGRCERCGTLVERRELEQWFLKITRYADRLLTNLEQLDWTEKVVALQRAWIGRSEGLEFHFDAGAVSIPVYTTRPDTLFGVTFVVLAPEHPLVDAVTTETHRAGVATYREQVRRTREIDRLTGETPTTGAFTGAYATHPVTGERVPIWIADYVLMDYGTGAIMAVPAHDARDMAFARAMGLPIRAVVVPKSTAFNAEATATHGEGDVGASGGRPPGVGAPPAAPAADAYAERGVLIESGPYSGMPSEEAAAAIGADFEARGIGRRAIKYHLRDWLISRQRYWGPPIPVIYCPEHGAVPVPEDQLPVLLPDVENYTPDGSGASPLAAVAEFVNTTCPICGKAARRETDVSDNFLDSAWYFLRYPSSDDETQPWNPAMMRKWLPPNMYIGGAEHSVLHLMYSRFITMALHDLGYLEFEEPFPRFRANGMITADGAKMSKSVGNVIDPDDYITRYGADVFRTYLLFMGPYEAGGDFSDRGIGGVVRFLNRAWQLVTTAGVSAAKAAPTGDARQRLHQTIYAVTNDMEGLRYNTAIAALMKYLNALEDQPSITRDEVRAFVTMLAPFAPCIADELWERVGGSRSVHVQRWPVADLVAARGARVTVVVQVNGKVRDRIEVAADASEEEVKAAAVASDNVNRYISGSAVRQMIYVPGRLVNIVTQ